VIFSSLTCLVHRLLSYLIQPKSPKAPNTSGPDIPEKEHTHRFSGAISSSIVSFGDLFKDIRDGPGSKSVKFPEKLLKVLELKLQNIAMGKDPACVVSQQLQHMPGTDNPV
jgi:hypothetical protein